MTAGAQMNDRDAPRVSLLVKLEIPDKPDREFSYEFQQSVITLGRDPTNDIQIPLTTVSRNHARIFYEMGDYFLEDLGSTHGTEHNRQRIPKGEKRLVRDGDQIRVMSFSIMFKTIAGTAMDRQPGEKTEHLARRMVKEVLASIEGQMDPTVLRVMNGPEEGRRLVLRENVSEITIGRNPDCDFTLNDQNISRRHCLIKREWEGYTAQDLGSKNGVVVNGVTADGVQPIRDGDEVQIGGVKLIFIDPPSRLLDQMGGVDRRTMDPIGIGETDPRDRDDAEDNYDEGDDLDSFDDSSLQPEAEDPVEIAPDVPEDDDEPEAVAGMELPAELEGEIAKASKGAGWDFIVLLVGLVFLVMAIGIVAFLVF